MRDRDMFQFGNGDESGVGSQDLEQPNTGPVGTTLISKGSRLQLEISEQLQKIPKPETMIFINHDPP